MASSRAMTQYSWLQKLVAECTRPAAAVHDAARIDFSHMMPDHLVNLEKTFKTSLPNMEYPLSPALRAAMLAKKLSNFEKVTLAGLPNFSDRWNDLASSLQRSLDQWDYLPLGKAVEVAAHNPEVRDQATELIEDKPEEVEELSQEITGRSFEQVAAVIREVVSELTKGMAWTLSSDYPATLLFIVILVAATKNNDLKNKPQE